MRSLAKSIVVVGAGLGLVLSLAPSASAATNTTITMKVTGCEGCTILSSSWTDKNAQPWNGPTAKVKNGVATLVVPTDKTKGMSFVLEPTWKPSFNAESVIVTQYEGFSPGEKVNWGQAKKAKNASACWSGTTSDAVAVDVAVKKVPLPAFPAGTKPPVTKVPAAYFVVTDKASGQFWNTDKGVLGAQDAILCTGSS